MCGIIGYVGEEDAFSLVANGLKNLEYRGYDSYGLAWGVGDEIFSLKRVGKVSELSKKDVFSNIAIGHTRWATHGAVTEKNAHPHFDCSGEIAVVHNGIIENYEELREELVVKGHVFESETDSEVIPHLIEEELKKGAVFEEACRLAFLKLEGSFALLVLRKGEGVIYGARKDSPLVLGVSDNGFFAASDAPAFLESTNKVVWLHNYDFFKLSKKSVEIFNLKENKIVPLVIDSLDWDVKQVKKGEFKHFMLKEILEQIEVLKNISKRKDLSNIDLFKKADRILLVGSGTSFHACLSAELLFVKRGIDARAVQSSEFSNYLGLVDENTLVVAVSQSGETADVLEAVREAKEKGAKVFSLVNVRGSSLERESDFSVLLNAGPEICVLSTKSYTSQVSILALIVRNTFGSGSGSFDRVWNELYNLTSKSEREKLKRIAGKMKDAKAIVIIGRNEHYATALEAGLKIREVSYIPVLSFAGGELKHGNIALVEKGTPCIVFGDDKETLSNAVEMKSRGGWIIGVSEKKASVFDDWVRVFDVGDFNPVMFVVPAQILAYYIAVLKGLNPDKPRNLAKSVTVK